jgi:hypothetical protein
MGPLLAGLLERLAARGCITQVGRGYGCAANVDEQVSKSTMCLLAISLLCCDYLCSAVLLCVRLAGHAAA